MSHGLNILSSVSSTLKYFQNLEHEQMNKLDKSLARHPIIAFEGLKISTNKSICCSHWTS
jgi:hypothetical protein